MNYACSHCKSENIQRLSAVYQAGVSQISTTSSGVGIGVGGGGLGIGVGSATTSGTSQTEASRRAAPPAKKRFRKPLLKMLGVYLLSFVILVSIFPPDATAGGVMAWLLQLSWIGASIWWIYSARKFNAQRWPLLLQQWQNTYLCNRCNQTSIIG